MPKLDSKTNKELIKHKTCFVCGNHKITKKGAIKQYTVMKCTQCGLQFPDQIPDKKSLNNIYSDYYKAWNLTEFESEVSEMKKRTFQSYFNRISPFIKQGRLLDIGCATGELLEVFNQSGFDVHGVEISPYGIKKCKERFGDNKIIGQPLKKGIFPSDFFDVITLSDVFEHLQNPNNLISVIDDVLKPNGILMITTPDTSSISNKLMGMNWPHYKKEHIFYYNRSNIVSFFSNQFDLVFISSVRKTLTLKYCSGILKTFSNSALIHYIVKLMEHLPQKILFHPVIIKTGEMFVLLKKKNI